jgi:uncharacterized membrane protein YphA (DoxX/SURF4 family)
MGYRKNPEIGDSLWDSRRYCVFSAVDGHERTQRRHELLRFFSGFPGGWPGLGLLLLRATVGIAAAVHGGVCLVDSNNRIVGIWAVGSLAVGAAALLLIGFLTTIASFLVGLGSAGVALAWFPVPTLNVVDAKLATFVAMVSTAIVFLGPGAFSLDSYLFGRREIIIPPASDSRKA